MRSYPRYMAFGHWFKVFRHIYLNLVKFLSKNMLNGIFAIQIFPGAIPVAISHVKSLQTILSCRPPLSCVSSSIRLVRFDRLLKRTSFQKPVESV